MRRGVMRATWAMRSDELLAELSTSANGLSLQEARLRLIRSGENVLRNGGQASGWRLLLRQVENPLVLILVFAAGVSILVQEWTDALIVLTIVAGSTILGFTQEYRASQAVNRLRERLSMRSSVLRDGVASEVESRQLVPGDVVLLSAGNLIPADGIVLEARDFLVSQAALTGESFPVEKSPEPTRPDATLSERTNAVYVGTSVRSGTAKVLVTRTGASTELASLSAHIATAAEETEFERGVRKFGYLLTRIMIVIVLGVITVNLLMHRPPIETLLFAVALAVGMSPELLPAIMTVTLAAGARRMADRGVIVRRLVAIEDLGGIDVLCTDKTGTLTKGVVELSSALDPKGEPSERVFRLAAINSMLETGIKNPLDAAIVASVRRSDGAFQPPGKVDEIPYDFLRKRLTIVVEDGDRAGMHTLVTKGAIDSVLDCCSHIATPTGVMPFGEGALRDAQQILEARGKEGFRALVVASRSVPAKARYDRADETDMVLEGFLLFFDPLKDGIDKTIQSLAELGIEIKIVSGDNRHVAAHVGRSIGLDVDRLLTGHQLSEMNDEALWRLAPATEIFAEVDPQQKERIVRALQHSGHAVAYMGDGINDAPALKASDVGVSVDQAVDVARETADIVLLQRDLDVLRQGVLDGRRTFANTLKYIEITTSANFGNMISMALATLFVPFLPLLAKQILLNNFLSDIPSLAISTDNVDQEVEGSSQRWDMGRIWSFMLVFGLASTVFDLITFGILLYVFQTGEALFQSTWFVVSLLTELAVVLVLRTHLPAWRSGPSRVLLYATIGVFVVALSVPYAGPIASAFGFVPIPVGLLMASLLIVAAYIATTEAIKQRHFAHSSEKRRSRQRRNPA